MLAECKKLNLDVQSILDKQTDAWGVRVSNVEIKHVDLDESMLRAIAQQAEAMQRRYLQTLTQIAGDKSSAIVFPLPLDILGSLLGAGRTRGT